VPALHGTGEARVTSVRATYLHRRRYPWPGVLRDNAGVPESDAQPESRPGSRPESHPASDIASDPRRAAAAVWAGKALALGAPACLAPASADASFRRYFRLVDPRDGQSLIVMDAPPAHEDCRPFIHVAAMLAEAGLNAPRILAQDLDQGFLLLTDLGHVTYLDRLVQQDAARTDGLYADALAALVAMQRIDVRGRLPRYDRVLLGRELDLFPEWYLGRHLGQPPDEASAKVIAHVGGLLLDRALAQPRVFVHRDYHSRNLMCSDPNPGILDFQDAVDGPITYDLASLLKDAYIDWDEALLLDWLARYWDLARRAGLPVPGDFGEFHRDFEWMGVQRHLKVLGIFARLAWRDGKRGYLDSMPRVRRYLRATCTRYRDLAPLVRWLDETAPQPG
jgi:aminoglycoside/choline kinase family phosphotransferase